MANGQTSPLVDSIRGIILTGFDDPTCDITVWSQLLAQGETDTVFLTPGWQRAWWESFGRGRLLLVAALRGNKILALAPLFAESGMAFFVGSGGSDYLDFAGDTSNPEVLQVLLTAAREAVPGFIGFRFHHVPDDSRTGARLQMAAGELGLQCFDEGSQPAPVLDLGRNSGTAINKKSLLRHQRYFEREGHLTVRHLQDSRQIQARLDEFFEQHIARWAQTPYPSQFHDLKQRSFYKRLAADAAANTWLRFTVIEWNEKPVAFHFGFNYRGRYMWYKPSFAIEHAKHSPGEVLLRQLLLAAVKEGAVEFDFGLGDEAFKARFATRVHKVRTWGIYTPEALAGENKPLQDADNG